MEISGPERGLDGTALDKRNKEVSICDEVDTWASVVSGRATPRSGRSGAEGRGRMN